LRQLNFELASFLPQLENIHPLSAQGDLNPRCNPPGYFR